MPRAERVNQDGLDTDLVRGSRDEGAKVDERDQGTEQSADPGVIQPTPYDRSGGRRRTIPELLSAGGATPLRASSRRTRSRPCSTPWDPQLADYRLLMSRPRPSGDRYRNTLWVTGATPANLAICGPGRRA